MKLTPRRRAWLLKTALVELGLWIARSDGNVSREEASRILHFLKDWGSTSAEIRELKGIGERKLSRSTIPHASLRRLPTLLAPQQRPIFLETLAEVAFYGQKRSVAKVGRLLDVCRAMGMPQLDGLRLANDVAARVGAHRKASPAPSPGLRNAMAVLGIESLDPRQARRAYQQLTLRYHPDRNPNVDDRARAQLVQRLMHVRAAYRHVVSGQQRAPLGAAPA